MGNTILGEKQFDLCVSSHSAINDKCKVGFRYFHPRNANLIVIDTPGFFTNEDDIEQSLRVAIDDGICAILLTLSLEFGLTNQEEKMIDFLKQRYGDKIFEYIIVVFTGLDKVQGDIRMLISGQCSSSLKKFLEQCGNRYVGIDNSATMENKDEFVSNLIELVMTLPSSSKDGMMIRQSRMIE